MQEVRSYWGTIYARSNTPKGGVTFRDLVTATMLRREKHQHDFVSFSYEDLWARQAKSRFWKKVWAAIWGRRSRWRRREEEIWSLELKDVVGEHVPWVEEARGKERNGIVPRGFGQVG